VSDILDENDIIISRFFDFFSQKIIYEARKNSKMTLKDIENFFKSFNYYYIKSTDNKYLLITPFEYKIISNYMIDNKVTESSAIIKNKYGIPVAPYENKMDSITNKELFVQLLLGNSLTYQNYINMFKYLFDTVPLEAIITIMSCFEENYGVVFYNKSLMNIFYNQKNLKNLLDQIKATSDEQFIQIVTGKHIIIPPNLKEDIEKIKGYTPISSGGSIYYYKYIKYKKRYMLLKHNLTNYF
jgi:hypothetical protein